jgi:hypothetical protein
MPALVVLALAMTLATGGGCRNGAGQPTGIVLEIQSQYAVPQEIDGIHVTVTSQVGTGSSASTAQDLDITFDLAAQPAAGTYTLPARMALVPNGSGNGPVHVVVSGLLGGKTFVKRSATLTFYPENWILLSLNLLKVCNNVTCSGANTSCNDKGMCTDDTVAAMNLPAYVKGSTPTPIDAGTGPATGGQGGATTGAAGHGGAGGTVDAAMDVRDAGSPDSARCDASCVDGQTTCAPGGGGVLTCMKGSDGCLAFVPTVTCGTHQTCTMPAGAATCQCIKDVNCSAAGKTCADLTKEITCTADGQGCFYPSQPAACTHQTCFSVTPPAGSCGGVCAQGETRCSDDSNNIAQKCGATGQWETNVVCGTTSICRRGACLASCGMLVAPKPTDALPFAVDSEYDTSGFFGDGNALVLNAAPDACQPAGGRASATALGTCRAITYQPTGMAGALGFSGVSWLFPTQNYSTKAGYPIPPGATKVTFQARGALGYERVGFGAGIPPPPNGSNSCADTFFFPNANVTLTAAWAKYTLPALPANGTVGGVIDAFSLAVDQADNGSAAVTFYLDDIRWE